MQGLHAYSLSSGCVNNSWAARQNVARVCLQIKQPDLGLETKASCVPLFAAG